MSHPCNWRRRLRCRCLTLPCIQKNIPILEEPCIITRISTYVNWSWFLLKCHEKNGLNGKNILIAVEKIEEKRPRGQWSNKIKSVIGIYFYECVQLTSWVADLRSLGNEHSCSNLIMRFCQSETVEEKFLTNQSRFCYFVTFCNFILLLHLTNTLTTNVIRDKNESNY